MKTLQKKLWKLFLRTARVVTLAIDDWIQRQEVLLREKAAMADTSAVALAKAQVDPVASAVREKAHKRAIRATKPRQPRLVYQHSEFVKI